MEDYKNHHHSFQTMNSTRSDQPFSVTTASATPTPPNQVLVSPMDEYSDTEQNPKDSINAKWYYSTIHNSAAMIGAGVLSLPFAMSELGWGPGVAVLVLAWVITLYTLWQMIAMHETFQGRRFNRYHELGQEAFGRNLGLFIIVPQQFLVQLSVCTIYMVTGGKSLHKVQSLLVGSHDSKKMDIRHFILIFASSEFVLSQLKNFNSLVGVSLVATVMSVSYSTIAWVASTRIQKHVEYSYRERTYGKTYDFLSGLGSIAFAYAGHNVVLEIQATMPSTPERPSTGPMWKGAFIAYLIVAFCYFPVATVGYHIFGNTVEDDVLRSLKKPTALIIVANLLVVLHLIGGYQVYSFPAFDLIETLMIQRWHFHSTRTLRLITRSTFVAVTMGVGLALPYFGALLGFLGGLVFVPTSYFIPCIIWLILKKPKRFSLSWWTNWICIIVGVLLMILASIGGIEQLVYCKRHGKLTPDGECPNN